VHVVRAKNQRRAFPRLTRLKQAWGRISLP
jgi:hypothetical protein